MVFASFCITTVAVKAQGFKSCSDILEDNKEQLKQQSFFIFPAEREAPIHWFDSIATERITTLNQTKTFSINAQPGEYFVYQVGVWAIRNDMKDIKVIFSTLAGKNGKIILPAKMTCFNEGGINFKGRSFSNQVNIPTGRVQSLWMGIDLRGLENGIYTGKVSITSGKEKQTIQLRLLVKGDVVKNQGYDEGKRLARLNWLNSTVGIDNNITKGYTPVKVEGNKINILGRTLEINQVGLPESITTFFAGSNQAIVKNGEPILHSSFRFVVEKEDGSIFILKPGKLKFLSKSRDKAVWTVLNTSDELDMLCTGQMEFDGFVDYSLQLIPKSTITIKDIRLEMPMNKTKAEYMMGLNQEGGFRTPDHQWKWDVKKNQDMLWIGAVNGGIRIKWKAENYRRPLVNIYYAFGPLQMPPSWGNNGLGGVNINEINNGVVVSAYSGKRVIKKGDLLNYNFELLITPFKLIDKKIKYGDRYYHGGGTNTAVKIENAKKEGGNIINIHQAEDIYPFINYPYLDANVKALTDLVANAHKENMRMKFYYTTRELTKNLPEFWALNSLNGEVIFPGPGNLTRTNELHPKGPKKWLMDNLREKYIPAWYDSIKGGKFKGEIDLSVITTPDSRLNNFYVAGLEWMVKNMAIDGVYIDDAALDRFTLMRARKIIDRYRPQGRMDLHSWNHFNKSAGFTNCLNLYMDLLPYFDLVWIGEGRNYDRMPDHWLIEVSGIPFGLPGQMLQGGGNPWRGMVYGITSRAGWTKKSPSEIWKFWDKYDIQNKEMIGYWEKGSIVKCSNPMIRATIYQGASESIIAVANWNNQDEQTAIIIDWNKLGLDLEKYEIFIPEIKGFQNKQSLITLNKMTIAGKEGLMILLKRKK
jgi:hypothetical protein